MTVCIFVEIMGECTVRSVLDGVWQFMVVGKDERYGVPRRRFSKVISESWVRRQGSAYLQH